MKSEVRAAYSLNSGRSARCFSVSRAPVASTRKYVITTGDSTVTRDIQPGIDTNQRQAWRFCKFPRSSLVHPLVLDSDLGVLHGAALRTRHQRNPAKPERDALDSDAEGADQWRQRRG